MKTVSLIYNHLAPTNLDPVLKSLLNSNIPNNSHEIIVIENGLDESQYNDFQIKYPQIKFINSEKFLGLAQGLNLGISEALRKQPDFIWITDPFILPHSNMFTELHQAASKYHDCLLFTPKVYNHLQSKTIFSAGYTTDWTGLTFSPRGQGEPDSAIYDRDLEIDYIPINQLFARTKAFSEFGYFDPRYFINFYELSFYQKVQNHGYHHNYISPAHATNIGSISEVPSSAKTYYYLRDKTYFSLLHAPVTTKLSSLQTAFDKYFHGSPWERRAILDVFSGNLAAGSYQWE